MKCSSPHLGNYYIGFETLFRELGLDYFPAPPVTKKTIELGVKYSPEFVCFPFKINMGNLIEALEQGAEILFQSGGRGGCRYGNYFDLQELTLKNLGFDFQMYRLFDSSNLTKSLWTLKKLCPEFNLKKLFRVIRLTLAKIKTIDMIENSVRRRGAYLKDKKELYRLEEESLQKLRKIDKPDALKKIALALDSQLKQKMDLKIVPLKIGIVGELYIVMEPYSNLNLELTLIDLGVEIIRPLNLSAMIKNVLYLNFPRKHQLKIARPYLKYDCCAHANASVAETLTFAREGLDGVIHLKPHACMPEVTAMSALYRVSKDYNLPLLFLSFDEHTSSLGLKTRVEAFVEILKRRRKKCIWA